ncbi:melanoma inhibitory activity protein 2-like isoform X1 [Mesocricetus auratus]|uniref:Melanoma inhibitory activity protein 2-like isoform X1 n=1 Tax=Mesocricetus auratus TaxID=10036 RepID=A0ABM2X7X8_MESAU|nr:melanoma inhibitory activity protein 2-like isoform X1 [Mesocricetus auratus]
MPPLLDLDEPEWSAVPSTKNDNKSNHNNNTVPNIPPAECKTPGPGFVPPPVPLDRDPRGRPFAWDPRRPPPFPLPPPGNIYGGSTDYFPPMDFAGPPFPPYPGQPYCDSFLQSQERFYSESGRNPGPRHHRNYYMPSSSDMYKPESSAVPSTVNDMKNDHSNSTVPNTPAECKTPGPGFIPPFVPQDRGPRDHPFAWDPRRPPRYPPPPPANNYGGPQHYFPPMDFDGPPFLPYPEICVNPEVFHPSFL